MTAAGSARVDAARLGWPLLARYGALRMPLALAELPLYVLLPAYYGRTLGVELALVGSVLFAARLADAIADPAIGHAMDRWSARIDRRRWIRFALPVLAAGYAAMFLPPAAGDALAAWLAATSIVTYLAYSVVSIAYQAWGAELGDDPVARARVTATREGFGLAGVLAAAALLTPERVPVLVAAFAALAAVAGVLIGRVPPSTGSGGRTEGRARPGTAAGHAGPAAPGTAAASAGAATPDTATAPAGRTTPSPGASPAGGAGAWREVLDNRHFRWLLAAFVLNGVATAIPATLVLFFVRDVLGASESQAAGFLVAYFLCGALGMPLWVWIAKRAGLRNAWLLGMAFAVLAFAWALALSRGDTTGFLAVCVLTGLALGADLALPSALLAGVIDDAGHRGRHEGTYFGVWNLATKLNLALAAGIGLPLLAALGYVPGRGGGTVALGLAYAALPSALKLAAGLVVLLAPLPEATPSPGLSGGTSR
ncbi:MAG: MFS transporter [Burkholderiaceae bacterium]